VSATEASRNFARLLDEVEHRGESYTIVRRGRPVAHLEPVGSASGARAKDLLRHHRIDRAWAGEVAALRSELVVEERF
jgi:prevent-host-death family protein